MRITQPTAVGRAGIGMESMVMLTICVLDVVSTAWLVTAGLATEANPLMAYLIERSIALFCGVRMATVLALVIAAEIYRRRKPEFVRTVMRFGILTYLLLYVVLLYRVNL